MKTCIIYHSYSGITRGVAGQIQAACGGDLIEVKPRNDYTRLTVYPAGGMRALRGYCDPIDPETIDVSFCDLIVIGSPVWAWKTTPPVNAALAALTGTAGKKAVIFATCGSQAGETLPLMRRALEEKGVMGIGEAVLTRGEDPGSDQAREGCGNPGLIHPVMDDPGSLSNACPGTPDNQWNHMDPPKNIDLCEEIS